MAENEEQQGADGGDKLYTLSEIAKQTGVSMPTLQRYKKLYQDRIPSVGEGRRQRYPESSLPVFNELKVENAGRRGRPRKDAAAPAGPPAAARGRKPAARKASAPAQTRAAKPGRPAGAAKSARAQQPAARRGRPPAAAARRQKEQAAPKQSAARGRGKEGLLTLTQISKETGISYPTLVRYVRLHTNRLPHEGTGRSRRFYPKAVDVFRTLRQESGRGERRRGPAANASGAASAASAASTAGRGRADAGLARQIQSIEKSQRALEQKLDTLLRGLKKAFS